MKTKHLIFAGLLASTGIAIAQSTSYDANALGIGGTDNCGIGFNALTAAGGQGNVGVGKNTLTSTFGQYNAAFGPSALQANLGGHYNAAFGSAALGNNTYGHYNSAVGVHALLWNSLGSENTAVGHRSLFNNDYGSENVAVGMEALVSNNSNTANYNVALGNRALYSNSGGAVNTASGYEALYQNISGNFNTAYGGYAAYNNTTGYHNMADGYSALFDNTTGTNNSASGAFALESNITGNYNSAHGMSSLYSNTSGGFNTAIGFISAPAVVTGSYNTAAGMWSLGSFDGNYNSGFGYGATTNGAYNNATAVGANAIATGNNRVRIGGAGTTVWCDLNVWGTSDQRFKSSVNADDVKGLEFIKLLRPVVYNFETKKHIEHITKGMADSTRQRLLNMDYSAATDIRQSGFLAQEVESAAIKTGYNFSGIHKPENDKDTYGLSYAQFVVPLVKGMQEQQQMIEEQQKTNEALSAKVARLEKQISELASGKTGNATGFNQSANDLQGFAMDQNVPNPFSNETVIKYTLTGQTKTATLNVYDLSGKQITSFPIERTSTSLAISSEKLAAGIYIYSIVADGKIMDSKRMVVAEK